MQDRHARYFLDLAERAEPELREARQEYWSSLLRGEYDNLRAALVWLLNQPDPLLGLRLVGALAEYWYYEGPISEGEKWMAHALPLADQAAPITRANLLNGAAMMAFARGDHERGKALNQEALALARSVDDRPSIARSLFWLAAQMTDNPAEYRQGLVLCDEALSIYLELDYKPGLAWAYNQIGELSRLVGDYTRARQAYQDSYAVCQETGNQRRAAIALVNLSYAAQHQGDYAKAAEHALQGLKLLNELRLKYHSTIVLAMLSGPIAALGQPARAAMLLGASEAIFESMSVGLQPADQVEIDQYIALVREQLGEAQFRQTWAAGRQMTFEQAVAFACSSGQESKSSKK